MIATARAPLAPFRVVTADCPWLFNDSLPGDTRGASSQYRCMPTWQIQRFSLPPIADEAWLFLWYVTSMRADADRVVEAWGFTPTGAELTWVKTTTPGALVLDHEVDADAIPEIGRDRRVATRLHFGMGRTVRNCDERCLIARRGRPTVADRSVRSVFFAPVGRHSEKPDRFYELVERLAGEGPRVELFARRTRPGWTCMGDQVPR